MKLIQSTVFLFLLASLSACTKVDSPESVGKQFWEAVMKRDMETAKQVSTWDSVDYLKYLTADKLHPERFELGESMLSEENAEIVTTLYTTRQGKSGVKVPGLTVLVKTEQGWRVEVKETLSSVVEKTVDNVFEQLNGFMQEGLKQLDKSLSESMKELGKALEQGTKDFKQELDKELSKPLYPDQSKPALPQNNESLGKPI